MDYIFLKQDFMLFESCEWKKVIEGRVY